LRIGKKLLFGQNEPKNYGKLILLRNFPPIWLIEDNR
jgi:hypothetical protein